MSLVTLSPSQLSELSKSFPPGNWGMDEWIDVFSRFGIMAYKELVDGKAKATVGTVGESSNGKAVAEVGESSGSKAEATVGESSGDKAIAQCKIVVPPNRCDLMCLEGLSQALSVFCGHGVTPFYRLAPFSELSAITLHHKSELLPYSVCAVLRDVTLDEASFNSFIQLNNSLSKTIGRRGTLVIETHDLDKCNSPFSCEVKNNSSGVTPVIYGSGSGSDRIELIKHGPSSITSNTKNILILCLATDLRTANIVVNTMVTSFSVYCQKSYEVEPVKVQYSDGQSVITPDLSLYDMDVHLPEISNFIGFHASEEEVLQALKKMQFHPKIANSRSRVICVSIPPNRRDILGISDVLKDLSLTLVYNENRKRLPAVWNSSRALLSDASPVLVSEARDLDYILPSSVVKIVPSPFASRDAYREVVWKYSNMHGYAAKLSLRNHDEPPAVRYVFDSVADLRVAENLLMHRETKPSTKLATIRAKSKAEFKKLAGAADEMGFIVQNDYEPTPSAVRYVGFVAVLVGVATLGWLLGGGSIVREFKLDLHIGPPNLGGPVIGGPLFGAFLGRRG